MANKVTDLFKKSSSYDKKHIKNLSTKKVPAALLQAVEKGCSFETLEKLAKGFPICKYQTQITVHGIFDDPSTRCVGFYVNLTKNKNQSLGIRWTAIDHDKKEKLFHYIKLVDNEWQIKEDSSSFYMCKMVRVSSQEALQKAQERYQAEVDKIDVNLFTGSANVFKLEGLWGMVYVGLALVIQCFPEGRFWQIAENITGKKKTEILAAEAFKKVQNYTFQPGDIVLVDPNEVDEKLGFRYHYYTYYKSFGKLCFCLCDENGKRLVRGTEVWKHTVAEAYVKKAA